MRKYNLEEKVKEGLNDNKSESKVKQFHELTEEELIELRERLNKRAKRQGRELLNDVRCVYLG
jgi:hypothetical protein